MRPCRLRCRPPNSTTPGKPVNASHSATRILVGAKLPGYIKPAELPVVATEIVTGVEPEPLSFTELGDTEQVDIAGAPVQLSVTVWLNPPSGATVTVNWAV